MKPLADRILAKPLPREDNKTEAGIILNNESKNKNDFKVVLIGDKVKHFKIGDTLRKYPNVSGIEVEYNGEPHFMFRENSEVEFVL